MLLEQKLTEMFSNAIKDTGCEIVRVQISGSQRKRLQIMIENTDEKPITVEDCTKVSRIISPMLDVEDPIVGEYSLEVSSPGLDRPLTRLKDFAKYQNLAVKLELTEAIDRRRHFNGKVIGVDDDIISFLCDGEIYKFSFSNVAKAKLVMNDELIALAMQNES